MSDHGGIGQEKKRFGDERSEGRKGEPEHLATKDVWSHPATLLPSELCEGPSILER